MNNALKTFTRQLIHAVGGLDAAASCCRVGRSSLSTYQDHASDQFMPVDVVLALEQVAGQPILTGAMARLQGFSLALPEAAAPDVALAVAAVARHAGEASARFLEANADGRIDHQERGELLRAAEQLSQSADAMKAAVAATVPALKVVAS